MEVIRTETFTLATIQAGSVDASKLVLCLPGRLDTKDYNHMVSHVEYFGTRGYLAVSFDPPGTWESPGSIELYTVTNYLKAIGELITYFGDRETALLGHSRGGSMAMLAGSTDERVQCFVSVMSRAAESQVSKEAEAAGVYVSKRDNPAKYDESEREFRLPLAYFEDCKQYDIGAALQEASKPKLFMYGTRDALVTKENVEDAFAAAASPKEIHELNSDHDYRKHPAIIDEVNKRVERFFQDHSFSQ